MKNVTRLRLAKIRKKRWNSSYLDTRGVSRVPRCQRSGVIGKRTKFLAKRERATILDSIALLALVKRDPNRIIDEKDIPLLLARAGYGQMSRCQVTRAIETLEIQKKIEVISSAEGIYVKIRYNTFC